VRLDEQGKGLNDGRVLLGALDELLVGERVRLVDVHVGKDLVDALFQIRA
jgi:hypothetical protein